MSYYLPETPRWLAKQGFLKESLQTVADLHTPNGDTQAEHVQAVFHEIQEAVRYEESIGQCGWIDMFTQYRKRTIVGITVQMFARLNGISIISFYLPSTLQDAGFNERKSLLYTAANAIPYTAATIVTWYLADRWGRRPLLILGGCVMAVFLAIVCAFNEADMPISVKANGQYAFVMLYNITYGFTWGPMPWLLPAEIFPLRGRSKGMALATASTWIFNFIIGMVAPDAFAGIGGYFYLIIAAFCLFSAGLAKFYYVETAGHTLEEIAVAFGDKAFISSDEDVMANKELRKGSAYHHADEIDLKSAPFAAYTSNKKDTPHRFDLAQCQTSECDAIDTDDQVTVRGEVARLTRLYDKAVKTNTLNDPDMYATGGPGDLHSSALRDRTAQAGPATIAPPVPVAAPAPETTEPTPAAVAPEDLDAAPATKSPEPEPSQPKDSDPPAEGKPPTTTEEPSSPAAAPTDSPPFGSSNDQTAAIDDTATSATGTATAASSSTTTTSAPAATAASDPDESPATAAHLQKHSQDTTDVEEKK